MCAETDSKAKKAQRQSLDEKNREFETVKSAGSLAAKSLLEEDDEDEQEEVEKSSLNSVEDDVRDTEPDAARGFSFDRSQFTPQLSAFSDPILCSNYGLCSGPLFDNSQLSDQIEMMTQCRHPMELFSLFNEHADREGVEPGMPMAYVLPTRCEYCGSESTKNCSDSCQRPRSLFRKKRPPFCPRGPDWDARTEEEIKKPKSKKETEPVVDTPRERNASPFMALSGFFASPTTEQ